MGCPSDNNSIARLMCFGFGVWAITRHTHPASPNNVALSFFITLHLPVGRTPWSARIAPDPLVLPSDSLPFVLLIEPLLQRREVIANRRRIHLARAGDFLQRILPRPADSHGQHRVQLVPRRLIPVNRAPVKRPLAPRRLRQ